MMMTLSLDKCSISLLSERSSEVIINLLQYKASKWGSVSLPTKITEVSASTLIF